MARARTASLLPLLALLACTSRAPASLAKSPVRQPAESAHAELLTAPRLVHDVGFDTPESVLYDERDDVYLVSNVVGAPLEADGRAFISRVRPDGSIEALKWIDSTRAGVELHAPKGMAVVADVLYVADLKHVRKFARATGQALGAIAVTGATFLHDLTSDREGTLYVSDSGLGPGLSASGSDAIYRITADGAVELLARSDELGQPSGLCTQGDELWVATFGTGELYRLRGGVRERGERLPKGSLDGLTVRGSRIFISSWEAGAVYERTEQGFREHVSDVDAPADLAIDSKRNRLLITHYRANALSIHNL